MLMYNVLIIDDEKDIREVVADILSDEGYSVVKAHNVKSAMEVVANHTLDLVILDMWLEGHHMDGIGLLRTIKKEQSNTPVIMISGHANVELAVQTVKLGAYDFIEKPFKAEKLLIMARRAIEARQLTNMNAMLVENARELLVVGASKAMVNLRNQVPLVAANNSRVLLSGESGVGKSFIAKAIHYHSKRSQLPFVQYKTHNKTNEQIFEELFYGVDNKASALEMVNGGTLFIDEIANLSVKTQETLLNVIQSDAVLNKHHKKIPLNVRFISSTLKNLEELTQNGMFNKTLLQRLNTVHLNIPPLVLRKQDIPVLAQHFCKKFASDFAIREYTLSDKAYSVMMAYHWPGNTRQLRNTIEKLIILAQKEDLVEIDSNVVSEELFGIRSNSQNVGHDGIHDSVIDQNYRDAKDNFERFYLRKQLKKFDYNITRTADFIGMDRAALHRKLKMLGIHATHEEK